MCECVKTKNTYYNGVRNDLKLEMCSFVMSFNNGAMWWIPVSGAICGKTGKT
jgi:hypothetical protein